MRVYCRGSKVGCCPLNGEVERVNVSEPATSLQVAQAKVGALLNPRNVVIVGASDAPGSWALATETKRSSSPVINGLKPAR